MKQVTATYNFLYTEQGIIQIIGNVNEVRATSIFDVFGVRFFQAKSTGCESLRYTS